MHNGNAHAPVELERVVAASRFRYRCGHLYLSIQWLEFSSAGCLKRVSSSFSESSFFLFVLVSTLNY